jgi:hypothetical protein
MENLSPSSLLPSQKVSSCLKLGSYGFSNFKLDKILCTLEIFGKIKLVAAHSSLQLSVVQRYTPRCCITLPLPCMHAMLL